MTIADYKTALVTGASSGIGAACVRRLREKGIEVVAAARRKERLEALAKETGCRALALDLNDHDAVYRELGGLGADVLVNNAGLGRGHDGFLKSSRQDLDDIIQLNVSSAIHVVRAVAEGMAERKRGHIVNIGSIAGLYPIGFPVYGASKGAIHLFNQHLRFDLKGHGIRITEICPGRVSTEFFDTAIKTEADRQAFTGGFEILQPDDVAQAIIFALDAPWRVNVSTIELTPTEQSPGGAVVMPVARG